MKLLKTKTSHTKDKLNKLVKKNPDATALIHINQCNTDYQNLGKNFEDVDKKRLYVGNVVTSVVSTTVFDAKTKEVESKIPDLSGLVKKRL